MLGEGKGFDLDLMLDRGRLELGNAKRAGSALVRVRFWDQSWKILLDSPGHARRRRDLWALAIRYAFRPADSNGNRARPAVPVASLALIVLQGTASVDVGGVTLSLKAPPGPAELTWNSLTGTRPQPLKREKLPDWANPELPPVAAATTIATAAEKFRKLRH